MKKILILIFVLFCASFSEVTHRGLTGTNIHTVYRWLFADSAARVNQSVVAADTMKLAFQRSDSTSWILLSTSGTKWKKIAFASNQNTLTTSKVLFNRIESSDTVKCKDLYVTDLTSGYIPYKSTNLENTNIFTNGVNTAIGKNSVESWGGSYRALQIGGNTAIMAMVNEEGKNNSWLLNNCYFDGAWKPYASGDAARFVLGTSGFEWTFDSSLTADNQFPVTKIMTLSKDGVLYVKNNIMSYNSIIGATGVFSGGLTGATLNTGNGANELYPMNQDVQTTASPTFVKTTTTRDSTSDLIVTDSVKGVTGAFSGALTGTTLNTGNGANELYPMNQAVTTTSDVTFDSSSQRVITVNNGDSTAILIGPNTSFGKTLRIGGWKASDPLSRIATSNGNIHIDNDTSAQGVYINEYFPENVYISNGGGTTYANKTNVDSLQLGTGSYLKTYVEGTMPCTLKTTHITVQWIVTAYYTKIGNVVNISFPAVEGTSNSTTFLIFCRLPYNPRQTYAGYYSFYESVPLVDAGVIKSGYVSYSSLSPTYITFNLFGSNFTNSGIKGTCAFTISYIAE